MYSITRTYEFSAAHRIEGHPKCGRLHGHNYKVTVELSSERLDAASMVLDYGDLDKIVKPLIETLDHRYLVSTGNLEADDLYAGIAKYLGDSTELPIPATTAEQLARMLFGWILIGLGGYTRRQDLCITVEETPKSTAVYYEEEASVLQN